MTQKTIKNIIFDNDGVNINSEHIAVGDGVNFIYELLRDHGGKEAKKITYQDIATRIKGHSSDVVLNDIIKEFNIDENTLRAAYDVPQGEEVVAYLAEQHTLRVIDAFKKGGLQVFDGFNETMDILVEKYGAQNIGLCTASRADRMDATEYAVDPKTSHNANWAHYFPKGNRRFSGHNLPNKYTSFFEANPDWKPEETICVEDSDSSVKKAIAAGAHSVVGCAYSDFQKLDDNGDFDTKKQGEEITKLLKAGAPIVVTDYRDIPSAIKWIENGMDIDNKPEFSKEVFMQSSIQSSPDVSPKLTPA